MSHESLAQFPTASRLHVSVGARDVDAAVAYYSTLFGQEPSKRRPDYAKWELLDPPANVSVVGSPQEEAASGPRHYGIQVKSEAAVREAAERLRAAGHPTEEETGACCYADQVKVWSRDPDGNRWEVFVVLADADVLAPEASECCPTGSRESTPKAASCTPAPKASGCCPPASNP
jgi:catechol 2,3-dioxygenase-like lactoylglutathione lyase family enzyme